jgi:uncharacterized protein (TIGR03435 family)
MTLRANLFLLAAAIANAQAPAVPPWQTAAGGKMSFDVAAVKPSKGAFTPPSFPLDSGDAYVPTGGRFTADFPLSVYISFAYKLSQTAEQREAMMAHLPKWVASDRFSIVAKTEVSNPTKDQMRLMMQALLADRFQLTAHFESQTVPVLALILLKPGKTGPNIRPHADGPPCDKPDPQVFPPRCDVQALMFKGGRNLAGSRNTTMDLLAASVGGLGRLGRPVVDQTGITGKVDFKIEWTPEPNGPPPPDAPPPADSPGTTFLQALREQLGMKLEPTTAPVQILVIDHVDRPSEN